MPQDLSIIGFDDLPVARWVSPPLTTVRQPLAEMGRAAAQMLDELIDGLPLRMNRVELSTELIVRASTAPGRPAHEGHRARRRSGRHRALARPVPAGRGPGRRPAERMTPAEKAAQLGSVWIGASADGDGVAPMQHEFSGELPGPGPGHRGAELLARTHLFLRNAW